MSIVNMRTQVLAGIVGLCLIGGMIAAGAVFAQTKTDGESSGGYKIGIVDRKAVFDAYDKRKDEFAKLEGEKNSLQENLDKMLAEIDDLREQYKSEADSKSEEERSALSETINSQIDRFTSERDRLQRQIDRKTASVIAELRDEIDRAVQEIGVKENYHVILDGGPEPKGPGRDVVYYSSTLNMTQKAIDLLNSRYAAQNAGAGSP